MHSRINELTSGRAGEIYKNLIKTNNLNKPHKFVKTLYRKYLENNKSNPSVNGTIFEYLICETLTQQKIIPFYYQAKFELVPNVNFDIVLYHPQNPVVLTMKVSLRERYKQADLEGWVLKQVYRGAKSYLVTLSASEQESVKNKIKSGAIMGLTDIVLASSNEYDMLLKNLAQKRFTIADKITPLQGKCQQHEL